MGAQWCLNFIIVDTWISRHAFIGVRSLSLSLFYPPSLFSSLSSFLRYHSFFFPLFISSSPFLSFPSSPLLTPSLPSLSSRPKWQLISCVSFTSAAAEVRSSSLTVAAPGSVLNVRVPGDQSLPCPAHFRTSTVHLRLDSRTGTDWVWSEYEVYKLIVSGRGRIAFVKLGRVQEGLSTIGTGTDRLFIRIERVEVGRGLTRMDADWSRSDKRGCRLILG